MPEIQSLTSPAHDLGQKVDWWNNAMLVALVVAAIAAVLVVITTRMVILRTGQLAEVQEEIIAVVNQKAGEANDRAAANEREAAELRKKAKVKDWRAWNWKARLHGAQLDRESNRTSPHIWTNLLKRLR